MYQNGKNITIIDHNVNCVDSILNDIRDTHPLSTEDEHQLWLSMQQGSKHARSRLIESNMRYVVSIAPRYILSGAALEDLILAGCEGLTRAADKFDGSLGYRFISFATWYVENEIRKTAYDYIKHNHTSLDGPVDADDERGATLIEFLADERSNHPDWNIRYNEALDSLAERAEKRRSGCAYLVKSLHQMLQNGYTTSEFARKYNLNAHQMSFLMNSITPTPSPTGPMVA